MKRIVLLLTLIATFTLALAARIGGPLIEGEGVAAQLLRGGNNAEFRVKATTGDGSFDATILAPDGTIVAQIVSETVDDVQVSGLDGRVAGNGAFIKEHDERVGKYIVNFHRGIENNSTISILFAFTDGSEFKWNGRIIRGGVTMTP